VETARSDELLRTFQKNLPATSDEIVKAENELGLKLPEQYREFLLWANGGEGFIGPNFYAMLWQVGDLCRFNLEYEVERNSPGLILFGSNGGGEGFAFDLRGQLSQIVSVPFIGMALKEILPLAKTFDEFLEHLGRG
jgi:hypothetical protein